MPGDASAMSVARTLRLMIVDSALYRDGVRVRVDCHKDDLAAVRDQAIRTGDFVWVGLHAPSAEELGRVAETFSLHPLAVEDAVKAHQRPKLERYDDILFAVLRPARYMDEREEVEFGELHVFTGPDFVVTIRHAEAPDLAHVRRRLEGTPDLLKLGPEAVLYAILDQVVDEYAPVAAGLENDIDEIEDQVFDGDPGVSRRIYELVREVIGFQRA